MKMGRFLAVIVALIVFIGFGLKYAPPDIRVRALKFLNAADGTEIVKNAAKKIMPENPVQKRTELTGELRQKIAEMKTLSGEAEGGIAPAADEALEIVARLQEANSEQSVAGRIAVRILDAVLPAPSGAQCTDVK